jgi:hypothetical protein
MQYLTDWSTPTSAVAIWTSEELQMLPSAPSRAVGQAVDCPAITLPAPDNHIAADVTANNAEGFNLEKK